MRALAMDFPADPKALEVADEFMFGPALLVSPVTQPGAVSHSVYLPSRARWYDFWTGASLKGGTTISAVAPLDTIPIYVRAGSIVPMGPELQWTSEKPADPLELRIYPGADGELTLYEDDGVSNDYEKGKRTTITFTWHDDTRNLTISAPQGSFTAMLQKRTFIVVLVGRARGIGEDLNYPDRTVFYDGTAVTIKIPARAH
jgi:alpha-D-xyloside xylohydrolase